MMGLPTQAVIGMVAMATAATASPSPRPAPDKLSHSIRTEGATRTAKALSEQQFDTILRYAERGDTRWLRAIADLRPGTDAARAEGIDEALSDALQTNPAEMLTLISSRSDLPRPGSLCEDRAIKPSQAAHQRFVRQAARAVQVVGTPALRTVRDQCLARYEVTFPNGPEEADLAISTTLSNKPRFDVSLRFDPNRIAISA